MTIAHVAYRLAHKFNGGVVALASMMGKGEKVLASQLNPNTDTHHLSIESLEMMADFTNGNFEIAEYFADKANAVVVPLPTVPFESDMGLLDIFMSCMKELGEVSGAFQTAYADGDITQKEFERISLEIDDVLARLMEFKAAVKRVSS